MSVEGPRTDKSSASISAIICWTMSAGADAARTPCRSAPLGAAAPAAAPKQPWSTRWRLHGEGAAAGQGLPSSVLVERRLPMRAEWPIDLRKALLQGVHPLDKSAITVAQKHANSVSERPR